MRGFVIGRSQISRLLADSWLAGLPDISIKCPISVLIVRLTKGIEGRYVRARLGRLEINIANRR